MTADAAALTVSSTCFWFFDFESQVTILSTSFVIAGVSMAAIEPARFRSVLRRMFSLPGSVLPAASRRAAELHLQLA